MLGSEHEGERANAAALATRLLRDHGVTWADVLGADQPRPGKLPASWDEPRTVDQAIELCLQHQNLFDGWEVNFIHSIARQFGYRRLSPKQLNVLEGMVSRVRLHHRTSV